MYEDENKTNNKIKNIEIILNGDDMCFICWEEIGFKKLCIKCKFKYCLKCAYKLNNKCCICCRSNKNDSHINFSELEINHRYSPFYTTISLFSFILSYSISGIIFVTTLVLLAKFMTNIIIYIFNELFYYFRK